MTAPRAPGVPGLHETARAAGGSSPALHLFRFGVTRQSPVRPGCNRPARRDSGSTFQVSLQRARRHRVPRRSVGLCACPRRRGGATSTNRVSSCGRSRATRSLRRRRGTYQRSERPGERTPGRCRRPRPDRGRYSARGCTPRSDEAGKRSSNCCPTLVPSGAHRGPHCAHEYKTMQTTSLFPEVPGSRAILRRWSLLCRYGPTQGTPRTVQPKKRARETIPRALSLSTLELQLTRYAYATLHGSPRVRS